MKLRLADVRVLVADDARVVGGRRGHHERRDRRRLQRLEAQVLDEVVRPVSSAPVGNDAGEIAVERVADQVGDARRSWPSGSSTTIA